jgi:hypothetical protein
MNKYLFIFIPSLGNKNIYLKYIDMNIRKYNSNFRKKLISRIDKLNNNDDYIQIYYIIINDIGNNFSSNRNGIFINLNLLNDTCIEQIMSFVDNKTNCSSIAMTN